MNWLQVVKCQVSSYSTEVELQQNLTEKAARDVVHRGEDVLYSTSSNAAYQTHIYERHACISSATSLHERH